MLLLYVGALIGGLIGGVLGHSLSWFTFGSMVLAPLFGIGVLYLGVVRRRRWGWKELGFVRPAHSLLHLVWWIPVTIVFGGLGATILGSLTGVEPADNQDPVKSALGMHWAAAALVFVAIALVIPVLEEIIFRRLLLDWLLTRLPVVIAAGITILAFTLAHLSPALWLYIVWVSFSLLLARLWFRSLWATTIIHVANNSLVTLVALSALLG